jgi:hypothetical protein
MKHQVPLLAGLIVCASLAWVPSAQGQLLPWRWFGPKAADKGKSALPDPRRAMEVNVEVAWLADPVTFPYYLEARADAARLEVRGYVPNKEVREHAVRIAQVYSSLPVTDALKEHASLLVKPTQMLPQQLQNSVQASLRVALPKQYQQLRIDCGDDGKVFVSGPVNNVEERIAVSHALRRLHGCTSVQNLTTLPIEVVQTTREKVPVVKTSNTSETKGDKPGAAPDGKSKSWFSWPLGKAGTTTEEPPLLEPRKVDAKNPAAPTFVPAIPVARQDLAPLGKPDPIKVEPASVKTPTFSVAELRKAIKAACPKAVSVEVELTSTKDARVTVEIRSDAELTPTAERVFALPELQNYRLDLQFKISAP